MRAFAAAVVCFALLAGGIYLGGRSVGAWGDRATAAPPPAPKVTEAQKRANKPTIWLNGRDQRAARAAVLTKADLGLGWKGGKRTVDFSGDETCGNYRPRMWDLEVNGAAWTEHAHADAAVVVHSQAFVLRTSRMVRLDWKRSTEHPNMLSCMRRIFARDTAAQGNTFVSLNRRPFPKLAPYASRFRLIAKIRHGSGRTIPFLTDIVFLGKGRHELTLTVAVPLRDRAAADRAEVRWAKQLLSRVRS